MGSSCFQVHFLLGPAVVQELCSRRKPFPIFSLCPFPPWCSSKLLLLLSVSPRVFSSGVLLEESPSNVSSCADFSQASVERQRRAGRVADALSLRAHGRQRARTHALGTSARDSAVREFVLSVRLSVSLCCLSLSRTRSRSLARSLARFVRGAACCLRQSPHAMSCALCAVSIRR